MPDFAPQANDEFRITIDGTTTRFRQVEHPSAPGRTHSMKAGKATVYHVSDVSAGEDYALKVMRHKHRVPELEEVCDRLDALKTLPGLTVCERRCLSPRRAAQTLAQYENLVYAILMPWMQGKSWFDHIRLGKQQVETFSKARAFMLAFNFSRTLARLEREGIAHCDLSAANIILDEQTLEVELIDVEDIFAPGFKRPASVSKGTPGYQHRTSDQGQWNGEADRFAASIVLSEILGWYDSDVREASSEESYFDPQELQTNGCVKLETLATAIARHGPALAELLRRAWNSATQSECPRLAEWSLALQEVRDSGIWVKQVPRASQQLDLQHIWVESVQPAKQYAPFWLKSEKPTRHLSAPPVAWEN